jgi:hypothetical protein
LLSWARISPFGLWAEFYSQICQDLLEIAGSRSYRQLVGMGAFAYDFLIRALSAAGHGGRQPRRIAPVRQRMIGAEGSPHEDDHRTIPYQIH